LSAIFLIHFWETSTATSGNLDFNHAEQIRIKNKHGGLHNKKICNGGDSITLANTSGVVAVQCFKNNCNFGQPGNPAAGFTYNFDIHVPKITTSDNSAAPNDGITTLVEIHICKDPNVTVSQTASATVIGITDINVGTTIDTFTA
jgi:hypothetical protein